MYRSAPVIGLEIGDFWSRRCFFPVSNTSIAVFKSSNTGACIDYLKSEFLDICVAVDAKSFDANAQVHVISTPRAMAVWLRYPQAQSWKVYPELGGALKCWWVHLLFQEHIVWEFNLYNADVFVDRFAPLPEIWGEDEPSIPDAEFVARIWEIKAGRIKNYLRPWSQELRRRKAYLFRDRYRYGQPEQGSDFLRALTGLKFPE